MTDEKFLQICNHAIKPLLDFFTAKDDHIKVVYDISEKSNALSIKPYYERIKDEIKKDFMRQSDGRIDRHKICACIYVTITTKRQLLQVVNGTKEKNMLVNAMVAFLTSCKI